jgi:uncharacterized membrane protein
MIGKLRDKPRQVHILIIIFLILTFISLSRSSLAQPQVTITLSEAGIAKVEYLVPTEGNLSVTVLLLGTPDPTLGVTVVDERGLPLAFDTDQTGRYLTVATLNSSQVYVSYYTQDLTSKSGIFWIISVNSPYPLKVVLPVNATPVDMNILPTKIYSIGRNLAIEYPAGSLQLKYVILYQPATSPPPPGTQPPASPTKQETGTSKGLFEVVWPLLPYLVVLAAIFVALAVFLALRGKRKSELVELGEEDLAILDALRKAGGAMFQGELQKAVNLPPTTLWRRVKKLAELGYVKIEKKAGRNYVELLE